MRLKTTNSKVAIDLDYSWLHLNDCPRNCKVQLLTLGGVALYGEIKYDEDLRHYQGWAPVPSRQAPLVPVSKVQSD